MPFLLWEVSRQLCKREREEVSIKQIAIVLTRKVNNCHNLANCIQITQASTDEKRKGLPTAYVPSLFVLNVMFLASKVDELHHVANYANLDPIFITEFWLKSHIHNNVVALESYNIIRRDKIVKIVAKLLREIMVVYLHLEEFDLFSALLYIINLVQGAVVLILIIFKAFSLLVLFKW